MGQVSLLESIASDSNVHGARLAIWCVRSHVTQTGRNTVPKM
jgi:hypothetical protein